MNAFVIPGISLCNEPLSETRTLREYDGAFAHTATIYLRCNKPEMASDWTFTKPWLVFLAIDDKLSKKIGVLTFADFDDAQAAADTWVYQGEVPA